MTDQMTSIAANMTSPAKAAMSTAQSAALSRKMDDTAKTLNGLDVGESLSEADLKKIDAAAQDFESMFISEMMKPMFESVDVDPEFGGGRGEEVFRGFMVQEYGKIVSKSGGFGLAAHVRDEMIRLQTGQSAAHAPAAASADTAINSVLKQPANANTKATQAGEQLDVAL